MKNNTLLIIFLSFCLNLSAQTYDNCTAAANATPIGAGTHFVGNLNGELPPIFCNGNDGNNVEYAEWLKYVPNDNYAVTINSDLDTNAGKDTRFNIYKGDCNNLVCVGGDDDSGEIYGNYLSKYTLNVVAGETYYIVWDNKWETINTSASNFEFELIEGVELLEPITFNSQNASISGSYKRGFVDINGDYLDDLVAIDPDKIYLKLQNASGGFTSVEKNTSVADNFPSWSLAAGDYNADGYTDLLYGDTNGVTFMKSNQTGTSGFDSVEYEEISFPQSIFSQRSNFVDVNNDGHLDAFVCHDTGPSVTFYNNGIDNTLIFNNTNGLGDYYTGGNYGSIWIDYDNDKDLDLYIAKCGGSYPRDVDQLYRNNGDGTFTEVGNIAGLADDIQAWSAAWGDFDNDGDMDVLVGSSIGDDHKLMRNNGDGTFTNVTAGSGISEANNGIEFIAADFDNDGNLDVFANGSFLFGNGDLTFNFFDYFNSGTSGGIGDANNDGFLDLFTSNTLRINNGNSNNWIKIVTVGDQNGGYSNINGIGARVEINTPSGTQIRDVQSGTGFRYMSTLNTHFGIGTDISINYVRVYWPSGIINQINNPNINDTLVIVEDAENSLGINDEEAMDLVIYPNPTKDVLYIKNMTNYKNAFYTIFDINGRRVANNPLNQSIDVSNLSQGSYLLRIVNEHGVKIKKFIKN